MTIYTPGIPVSTNFPADDQPNMQNNTDYLYAFGDKDHKFTKDSALAYDGFHQQVSLYANLGASPKTAASVSVIYPKDVGSYSQLFFDNGAATATGTDAQLTVNRPASGPNAAIPSYSAGPPSKGVSYLPGGLLIQYGSTQNAGNTSTFPVAFSAVPYSITVSYINDTSLPPLGVKFVSASGFSAVIPSGAPNLPYYWIAIGPA